MKMKWCIAVFLTVIIVVGCASEPPTGHPSNMAWYQAGISAEQTRRDLADCQNESLVNGRAYSPIPAQDAGASIALGMLASSAEYNRENEIVQSCMISKGYSLVKTNSSALTESQPQLAYVTPEIEAKMSGHWLFVPSPEKKFAANGTSIFCQTIGIKVFRVWYFQMERQFLNNLPKKRGDIILPETPSFFGLITRQIITCPIISRSLTRN
jgi:hypothetical protein